MPHADKLLQVLSSYCTRRLDPPIVPVETTAHLLGEDSNPCQLVHNGLLQRFEGNIAVFATSDIKFREGEIPKFDALPCPFAFWMRLPRPEEVISYEKETRLSIRIFELLDLASPESHRLLLKPTGVVVKFIPRGA